MPTVKLPLELVEKAVKFAHGGVDGTTLASCASVCRSWRALSRPYIFERTEVSSSDRLAALEDLVEQDGDVGPLVRTLVVRPALELTTVPAPWFRKLAKKLPAKLERLQAIELACLFELGDAFDGDFVRELAAFASVSRLVVDQCGMHMSLVYALAAALPALRDLRLGVIMPAARITPRAPEQLHPLCLDAAALDVGDVYPRGLRDVVDWVLASPSRETLRSLTLVARLATAPEVGRVLRELGPQLAELDLKLDIAFPAPLEAEIIRTDISLEHCTALRALTLRHHNPLSDAVAQLVAEVRAPLKRIALGVLVVPAAGALPDFLPLAAVLGGRLMDTLHEELLFYSSPVPESVVLAKLERDLPVICAKGVLKVHRV